MCIASAGYAQDYAYTFKGNTSPAELTRLEESISTLDNVRWVKIKYKEDQQAGEILIAVEPKEVKGDNESQDLSTADLKKMVLDFGLSPINFRSL